MRARFSILGFLVAGVMAPALSVLIYAIGSRFLPVPDTDPLSSAGGLVPAAFLATIYGLIPSLAFGGMGLAVLRKLAKSESRLALAVAGGAAAGLYVAAGLAMAAIAPGFAVLIAIWTGVLSDTIPALVFGAIGLSGVVAGLIYSAFAKRG